MELFYRQYGSAYPLIILHGLYGSSDNWISIANSLSDSYRVILPDQRNHGRSPHHPVHSYKSMSLDLHELTEKLELDKFILAGHSMGGKTAACFARSWPEKLAGLVIIDITPFSADPGYDLRKSIHYRILKRMKEADLSKYKSRDEAAEIFSDITGSERIINFLLKNIERKSRKEFEWKLNPGYLLDNIENIYSGFEVPGTLPSETISGFPVFFLRAMLSDYISESDYEPISRLFPAAEIIEVPGASHWVHAEKPGAITDLIKDNFPA